MNKNASTSTENPEPQEPQEPQETQSKEIKPKEIEHTWAVRVFPNEQIRIMECVEAGSHHNDFIGVFKFQNFYYMIFRGFSKQSAGNFIQSHFQVKEIGDFIQKKGRIVKAVYWNEKEFKGFALNRDEVLAICEGVYKNPNFIRLNDLSKPEIDFADDPSDTLEIKIMKTESYLAKCSSILQTLRELKEGGAISTEGIHLGIDQIKDNFEKLSENLKQLRELISSKPGAEKIAETLVKLHPYKKWNQIIIPTIVEGEHMKITAVDVLDPDAEKPVIKIKLQKIIEDSEN